MNFDFLPDFSTCRLCGTTANQRQFWREPYLGSGQSLRRCGCCGNVYLLPDFSDEGLTDFYRHQYRKLFPSEFLDGDEELFFRYRGDDYYAAIRMKLLELYIPQNGAVFELGSGFGSFLGVMGKERPDVKLFAEELDSEGRVKRLQGAAVQFIDDRAERLGLKGKVDLAVAFHVLEHVPDPIKMLSEIRELLLEGGVLAVEVPDVLAHWKKRNYVHPAHLSYFSIFLLQRLFLYAGYQVIQAGKHPGGPAFVDTIWIVGKKTNVTNTAPMSVALAANSDEINLIDSRIASAEWGACDELYSRMKRMAVSVFGPGPVGRMQRLLQYYRRKRACLDF